MDNIRKEYGSGSDSDDDYIDVEHVSGDTVSWDVSEDLYVVSTVKLGVVLN